MWDHKVYCFDPHGTKITKITLDDNPAGLGWLSDGSLLITSLMKRKLLRYDKGRLSTYKTLDIAAPGYCHDFTVTHDDVIYLSASGFYPGYNVKPVKSNILMIASNKDIKIVITLMESAMIVNSMLYGWPHQEEKKYSVLIETIKF